MQIHQAQVLGLGRELELACATEARVLISGPTGSGKSRLASWIHAQSPRRDRPLVTINLASLHEGTLESELFGHERGAFTGADLRRRGRLEEAHGGTVFLDEIGELAPKLQARLLEFLQTRRVVPVGGNRATELDVRVIAATQRDLERDVREGRFREDLFHRLRVVELKLHGLASKRLDFGQIVHVCLEELARETSGSVRETRAILGLDAEVAQALELYPWPGNVRELRNVLEYACLSARLQGESRLAARHLPDWFWAKAHQVHAQIERVIERASETASSDAAADRVGLAEVELWLDASRTLQGFERHYLRSMLDRFGGRINLTARSIGMNKTTLIRRLRELGVAPAQVSAAALAEPLVASL